MKDHMFTLTLVMCLLFMPGCSRELKHAIQPKTGKIYLSSQLSAGAFNTVIKNDTKVSISTSLSNLSVRHKEEEALQDSETEQIKQVIHQYYAAEKAGDFAAVNQIRDDALAPDKDNGNIDEVIRSYKDNAEKTVEDLVVREINVNLMPDRKSAVVNIVYWFVRKDFPQENRGFPRKKNIVYEAWGMKKKNEKWRLIELKRQYTEEEFQRNRAYEPVDALYQHLTSVLSDSEHGGVSIIDTTDYSSHTDDYLPHSYQLLIWVIDEAAVRNAIDGYSGKPVAVSCKKRNIQFKNCWDFVEKFRKARSGN